MLRISYLSGGKEYVTTDTDDKIEVISVCDNDKTSVTVKAKEQLVLLSAENEIKHSFDSSDLIFSNGYQSWTETKEFAAGEGINDLSKLPGFLVNKFAFKAYGSQQFEPMRKNGYVAFDLMYIKGKNPLYIGSKNYKNAYLMICVNRESDSIVLKSDINGKMLEEGDSFNVFEYRVNNDPDKSMTEYFSDMNAKTEKKLFGYTSWYNHYQNINEEIIEKALSDADERFDLFQIDDGFEPYVGDWFETDKKKFPNGLQPVVNKIHEKGMLAGIWLAPFAAERKSAVIKEHPDFFKKDDNGMFVLGGNNWSGFAPVDLDNPEAVQHVRNVLQKYVSLGFDFFKLDFLYAANLSQMKGKTRAETAEFAYDILCEELKGKIILGCGATMANAYEKFDFMRIGPDVSLKFDDMFFMKHFHPERISTKVTLCNTIFRHAMNGHAFGNDPDVFLLRDENISLSQEQRYALTVINALFGSLLMTSDNPKKYDEKKKGILDYALELNREGKVIDFYRDNNLIHVNFELKGEKHEFDYDITEGVLKNER